MARQLTDREARACRRRRRERNRNRRGALVDYRLLRRVDSRRTQADGDRRVRRRRIGVDPDDRVLERQRTVCIMHIDATILDVTGGGFIADDGVKQVRADLSRTLSATKRSVVVAVARSARETVLNVCADNCHGCLPLLKIEKKETSNDALDYGKEVEFVVDRVEVKAQLI